MRGRLRRCDRCSSTLDVRPSYAAAQGLAAALGTLSSPPHSRSRKGIRFGRTVMKRLFASNCALFVIVAVVIVVLNMVLFGDTLGQAVASPDMWFELLILAGTLLYLDKD